MSTNRYRRGSIFWALTLIAVGVLFLWQNFNPALHPWHIIAKFWPVLIIFWGLSKLMDYINAHSSRNGSASALRRQRSSPVGFILVLGTLVSKVVLKPWQWGSWGIE